MRISESMTGNEEYFLIYSSSKILMVHHGKLLDNLGIDEKSLPLILKINVLETFSDGYNDP